MRGMPRSNFPPGSLLAAMLGEHAPMDVRRAARRLRAEGTPALAVDDDIAELARGLAGSEVGHSPAVPDALPPLFWLEAWRDDGAGVRSLGGWIVEKKEGGVVARGFAVASARDATPEPGPVVTMRFDGAAGDEDEAVGHVRGLLAAVGLPGMMAQMGEASPVALVPADAPDADAAALRGFRLSVALSPDSLPD